MQKSYEIRFPLESEFVALKKLWQTSFNDTEEGLASFFSNTVSPERVLAVFEGGLPVSALYMLESEILINKKYYSAYYIYAVCTHPNFRGRGFMKRLFERLFQVAKSRNINYLFLVPEEKYLFDIYKKLGFEKGFSYSLKELHKEAFSGMPEIKSQELTYEKYREIIFKSLHQYPVAVLKESTFNSFFNSASGQVRAVLVENEGYALWEECEELTVFELFGNEELLLNAVFQHTERERLFYRHPATENSIPYGMYYSLNGAPEIHNGFFGISYSN